MALTGLHSRLVYGVGMENSSSLIGPSDPNAVARRLVQRAHLRDGLPEISIGFYFLLASGLVCAQVVLPKDSISFKTAVIAFALLIPFLSFSSRWALRWVRRRYLIARVGYVQSKPVGRRQIAFGIMLVVLVAVALFGVVPRLSQPDRWVLAGTGLFGGALAAWCGRLPRFAIAGVLMAATGVFLAFSGVSLLVGLAILFGSQGVVALISGAIVFLRFIRQPIETGE